MSAPILLTHETLDPEKLLKELTLDEKITLTSGIDMWHTRDIERVGLPSIRTSDGPNGVRGTKFFDGVPASCFPCGSGLGATFNVPLLEQVGAALGDEAIAKGAAVVLGPTCNLQRNPLNGRGFESYSEDPLLSGKCAAAFVKGLQSKNVGATIKHFVANDSETLRNSMSSEVPERALRELYLRPFEIAVRESNPWSFMTSYNRLNGKHCSESKDLIDGILRKEWGWNGMVMSDWWGVYSTREALEAGLDLEMPGKSVHRGTLLGAYIRSEKVFEKLIDTRVLAILKFIKRVLKAPISYPDKPEKGIDTPEMRALLRQAAREAIVLLKNDQAVLPLDKSKLKKIAVIGQNADKAQLSGGGSAALRPTRAVSPLDGIKEALGESVEIEYTVGAYAHKLLPLIGSSLKTPSSGGKENGFDLAFYKQNPFKGKPTDELIDSVKPFAIRQLQDSYIFLANDPLPGLGDQTENWVSLSGDFTADRDAEYEFSIATAGKARLYVDGKLLIDNWDDQVPGDVFFGSGAREEKGICKLAKGSTHRIVVHQHGGLPDIDVGMGKGAFRVGMARVIDEDEEIEMACESAKSADAVVLVCGLNLEWETEGMDRKDMKLLPAVDKLVSAVLKANPKTIIVNQSGTPVEMPWVKEASTLVHAWFGGNELGGAIADVLFGDYNPSGKLSQTFPVKLQDSPGFLGFPGENGKLFYNDYIFAGYRGFDEFERVPLFPFGHGLSYTTFSLSSLSVPSDAINLPSKTNFSVKLKNTGTKSGAQVVQAYITPPAGGSRLTRPKKELKAFAKVYLEAGEEKTVELSVEKDAFGYWDDRAGNWVAEKAEYGVVVTLGDGTGKDLKGRLTLAEEFTWVGL